MKKLVVDEKESEELAQHSVGATSSSLLQRRAR